jgi:hypothetical protein
MRYPILALPLLLLVVACDGGVYLKGVAYRWRNAPAGARSQIVVDEPWTKSAELVPLPGVEVTIYPNPDRAGQPPEPGEWESASDHTGAFNVGGTTAPGKHTMALFAKRAGCGEAVGRFVNHGSGAPHTVAIIMVCPDSPGQP